MKLLSVVLSPEKSNYRRYEPKWEGGGIMNGDETGTFTYTVTVKNITNYQDYPDAWLQYQLVALDVHLITLAIPNQYLNSITIAACG